MLLLGLAVVLGVTGIALLFRKVRNLVLEPVIRGARAAGSEIAGVFRSPLRVGELIGGSAGTTLSYILALVASVQAMGGGLSVAQIGAAFLVGVVGRERGADAGRTRCGRSRARRRAHRLRHGERPRGVGRADVPARDVLAAHAAGLVRVPVDASA